MAGRSINLAVFLILISLISSANAQLLVDLAPISAEEVISLYPEEIAHYKITIFNSSASDYEELKLKVMPQDGIVLIFDFEEEKEKYFLIDLKAGEQKVLEFTLKPNGNALPQNYNISVYYGLEEYSKSSTTYLNVIENPIDVMAQLETPQTDPGSYNKLIFSIKNTSEKNIDNFSANLKLQTGLSQRSDNFSVAQITPEDKQIDAFLEFSVEPKTQRDNSVMLEFSYDLEGKKHRFQKNFNLIVEDRSFVLYIAGGLLALLAIFVFLHFSNKKSVASDSDSQE
ncbi:MAG: hypothetical protein V1672_00045 [Candidatus Diapherotrites archaeon]